MSVMSLVVVCLLESSCDRPFLGFPRTIIPRSNLHLMNHRYTDRYFCGPFFSTFFSMLLLTTFSVSPVVGSLRSLLVRAVFN